MSLVTPRVHNTYCFPQSQSTSINYSTYSWTIDCMSKCSYTPSQIVPFPEKPLSQAQVDDPIVLVHVAFTWQSWPFPHSSISKHPNKLMLANYIIIVYLRLCNSVDSDFWWLYSSSSIYPSNVYRCEGSQAYIKHSKLPLNSFLLLHWW
jgi:hypothetical protein